MKPMRTRISVEYTDGGTVIAFNEEKILEETDIQALQNCIMSVIDQSAQIKLILDFRNVKFLSSAVLGLLIRISKKVYEYDGKLRLCNIDPKIYEIFKITRLTRIFDIYHSIDDAVESLSSE